MKRELYLSDKLHTENLFAAIAKAVAGIILIILKPFFGLDIVWRNLIIPSYIVFWLGVSLCVISAFMFIFMEKKQPMCLRCKKGLIAGEAAFPAEFTDFVCIAFSSLHPAALTGLLPVPPGSLYNTDFSLQFIYCPVCRTVGELTTKVLTQNYQSTKQVIIGESAQLLAYICDFHKQLRE